MKFWSVIQKVIKDSILDAFQLDTDFANLQSFRRQAIRFILIFFVFVMILNFVATKTFNPQLTYHDGISALLCIVLITIVFTVQFLKRFFWLWLCLMLAFFGYVTLMGFVDKTGLQVGAIVLTVIMPIVGVHFIGRLGAVGCWLMGSVTYIILFRYSLLSPPPELYFGGYSQIYDLLIMAFLALTLSLIIALTLHEAIFAALERAKANLRRARQSEQERLRFFGAVSHEVRNSVNGMFGLTSALLQDDLDQSTREKVELIQASGSSLIRVLNDTLNVTRLESNSLEIVQNNFDLHALLARISSRWQLSAGNKALTFSLNMAPNLPRWIVSDPGRIEQIIENLLSNALKFTHDGKIELHASPVLVQDKFRAVQFHVTDTGCGIHPDRQSEIFEPYRQEADDTFLHYGGTGLGLYICRLLVNQMAGSIWLEESKPGRTCFVFEISTKAGEGVEDQPREVLPTSSISLADLKILAVDDRMPNLHYLKTLFRAWDLKMETALSGTECLHLMQKQDFDLLLLDLNMPEMSGWELLRHIRALETLARDITVIVISADIQVDETSQEWQLTSGIFLTKPIAPEQLWDALHEAARLRIAKTAASKV